VQGEQGTDFLSDKERIFKDVPIEKNDFIDCGPAREKANTTEQISFVDNSLLKTFLIDVVEHWKTRFCSDHFET
jgi:hypothetical protein